MSDWNPDKTKAIPLSIGYNEAVVVADITEWSIVMNLITVLQEQEDIDRDDKYFLEGIKQKIISWVNNSGFSDFPEGYLD